MATIGDAPVEDAGVIEDTAPPPPDTAVDAPTVLPCVEGDARAVDGVTGTCYFFVANQVPWDTADADCQAASAHLATSLSTEENNFILALVADPVTVADVWMGATDRAVEGLWNEWITGELIGFEGWRLNEPNNNDVNDPNGEDCMVMEVDNGGTWDDRSCANKTFGYFCQREVP